MKNSTVVILKEQIRVTDSTWRQLLSSLRKGEVQQHDLQTLRELIIDGSRKDDLKEEPWASTSLVTPRHTVRMLWNEHSTRKSCEEASEQLLICTEEDMIDHKLLTLMEKYCLAMHCTQRKASKVQLPSEIELARGMKVLVTNSTTTDLDITNGTRGEIIDVISSPDEPRLHSLGVRHLPVYILVRLPRTRASVLDALSENVVPIEPLSTNVPIEIPATQTGKVRRSVTRRQSPITPAYALTDYRSQGQTISHVIVDLASPSGPLSSTSPHREAPDGRLLRDFDDHLFSQSFEPVLIQEDGRLEALDKNTAISHRQPLSARQNGTR